MIELKSTDLEDRAVYQDTI